MTSIKPYPRHMDYVEKLTFALPSRRIAELALIDDTFDAQFDAALKHAQSYAPAGWSAETDGGFFGLPQEAGSWTGDGAAAFDNYADHLVAEGARRDLADAERGLWFAAQLTTLTDDFDVYGIHDIYPVQGVGQIEGWTYSLRIKNHAGVGINKGYGEVLIPYTPLTDIDHELNDIHEDFDRSPLSYQKLAFRILWGIRQRVAADACSHGHDGDMYCDGCRLDIPPFVAAPKWRVELPDDPGDEQRTADIAAHDNFRRDTHDTIHLLIEQARDEADPDVSAFLRQQIRELRNDIADDGTRTVRELPAEQ